VNPWYLTLVFPLAAVLHGWITFRRASDTLTPPVPMQFSLVELMAVSFAAAFWFTVESSRAHPYTAACRAILCFCALLATHDIAPNVALLRRAFLFVILCVAFAATEGIAMAFWWAWLLFNRSGATHSRAGAHIVVAASVVYSVSFLLPLWLPKSPSAAMDNFWGHACFVGALAEGLHGIVENYTTPLDQRTSMQFQILWSANVLLWIAWLYAARRKFAASLCVSLFAVAFAFELYLGDEAHEMNVSFEFFPAYHAWMFSMFLTAVLALLALIRKTKTSMNIKPEINTGQ
jgi:hypothetical protein